MKEYCTRKDKNARYKFYFCPIIKWKILRQGPSVEHNPNLKAPPTEIQTTFPMHPAAPAAPVTPSHSPSRFGFLESPYHHLKFSNL